MNIDDSMMSELLRGNARALSLASRGFHVEAHDLLLASLIRVQELIVLGGDSDNISSTNDTPSFDGTLSFGATSLEQGFSTSSLQDWSSNVASSYFVLYPKALYWEIYPEIPANRLPCIVTLLAMGSTLAYNQALFHHQLGLVTGNVLHVAHGRFYYSLALSYIDRISSSNSCCGDTHGMEALHDSRPSISVVPPSLLPLSLAIYNNLGHLASLFGDAEYILHCRQAMEQQLQNNHPAGVAASIDEDTLKCFCASLARARSFDVSVAAAA